MVFKGFKLKVAFPSIHIWSFLFDVLIFSVLEKETYFINYIMD